MQRGSEPQRTTRGESGGGHLAAFASLVVAVAAAGGLPGCGKNGTASPGELDAATGTDAPSGSDDATVLSVADIVIRRIRREDARAARDIRLRALASDPLAFGSTLAVEAAHPDTFWTERAEHHAAGPDRAIMLALRDDVIVGIIAAVRDADPEGVFGVYAVWVAPEERRAGIGARLLLAIETWIVDNGGRTAQLFVSDHAPSARRLYERAGFLPDSRTEPSPHAGVTEHGMRKVLVPPSP